MPDRLDRETGRQVTEVWRASAVNTAVIPLLIIIYAFAEAFSPHRSFGALVVRDLHLTGSSVVIVRDTFTSVSSGKTVALSISLISLLITGQDVSATAQLAYARAFSMTPLRGFQKHLRGAGWLVLLLALTVAALALRGLAAGRTGAPRTGMPTAASASAWR